MDRGKAECPKTTILPQMEHNDLIVPLRKMCWQFNVQFNVMGGEAYCEEMRHETHRLMLLSQKWAHHSIRRSLLCQCLPWQSLCQMLTTWYWTSQPPQQGAVLDSPVCSILFQQHKGTKPWGTKAPFGRHCSPYIHSPGTEEPGSHTPHTHLLSSQHRETS